MSFEPLDIISEGLKASVFGDVRLAIAFGLLILLILFAMFKLDKIFFFILIIPLVIVFTQYIGWLYIVLAFIIGFALSKAFIRMFNQE